MQIFDPMKGVIEPGTGERDVSAYIAEATEYVRKLKASVPVEDLVKMIQKAYPLTNQEAHECILKVDAEIKAMSESG